MRQKCFITQQCRERKQQGSLISFDSKTSGFFLRHRMCLRAVCKNMVFVQSRLFAEPSR